MGTCERARGRACGRRQGQLNIRTVMQNGASCSVLRFQGGRHPHRPPSALLRAGPTPRWGTLDWRFRRTRGASRGDQGGVGAKAPYAAREG
eukprot:196977-Alexandrium_andersonii.AAC.1